MYGLPTMTKYICLLLLLCVLPLHADTVGNYPVRVTASIPVFLQLDIFANQPLSIRVGANVPWVVVVTANQECVLVNDFHYAVITANQPTYLRPPVWHFAGWHDLHYNVTPADTVLVATVQEDVWHR